MATIKPWGLGRHTTSLIVTMQTLVETTGVLADSALIATLVASTGDIGAASPGHLVHTAQLADDIQWVMRHNHEAIQALTRNRLNHVATTLGGSFTLAEIVRKGAGEARLADCWYNSTCKIAKISFYFGGAGWVVYARMDSHRMRLVKTKNVDVAEFVLIDANTAPTLTAGMR